MALRDDRHPMSIWQMSLKPGDLIGICMNNSGVYPTVIWKLWDPVRYRQEYGPSEKGKNNAGWWRDVNWSWNHTTNDEWINCIRHTPLFSVLSCKDGTRKLTVPVPMASGSFVSRRIIPYPEELLNEFEKERLIEIRKRLF